MNQANEWIQFYFEISVVARYESEWMVKILYRLEEEYMYILFKNVLRVMASFSRKVQMNRQNIIRNILGGSQSPWNPIRSHG